MSNINTQDVLKAYSIWLDEQTETYDKYHQYLPTFLEQIGLKDSVVMILYSSVALKFVISDPNKLLFARIKYNF
jgi:hypothetical protein